MRPVQDVHHVLLELLVLLVGPEVRRRKGLLGCLLLCVRVLGIVFKVEELIASHEGLGGGQASVEGPRLLRGRGGFYWLSQWLEQGGLRLDLPQQGLEVARGVPGGVKVGFHLCPQQRWLILDVFMWSLPEDFGWSELLPVVTQYVLEGRHLAFILSSVNPS